MSFNSYAQDELASFCFKGNVNLTEASESLKFLLLQSEKVAPRFKDHCLDVVTSTNRIKLLETFLTKRYTLVSESQGLSSSERAEVERCQIDFETTSQKTVDSKTIALGKINNVGSSQQNKTEVSTQKLLMDSGKQGSIDVYGRSLEVECRKVGPGNFQLAFFFKDQAGSSVKSEITVGASQVVNVGNIVKDLDDKNKLLGLPLSRISETKGFETVNYEMKVD